MRRTAGDGVTAALVATARRAIAAVALGGLATLVATAPTVRAAEPRLVSGAGTAYRVQATGARLNRRVLGPVAERVEGVPARPVDGFVWDGVGSTPIDGTIVIELDPASDRGAILATWTDEHGDWTYRQGVFRHPHHVAGVRVGSSVATIESRIKDAVVANVYLHGDTTAGQPVLPTVFAYLAAWGPAEVTLDGRPFVNPYGLPGPLWEGHVMVTEGVRGEDGSVRTTDGAVYAPSKAGRGATDPGDLEVHLVFHDERYPPVADNVPPLFEFFYHLLFENVAIELVQFDTSIALEGPTGRGAGRLP